MKKFFIIATVTMVSTISMISTYAVGPVAPARLTLQEDRYDLDVEHSDAETDSQTTSDLGSIAQMKLSGNGRVEIEVANHGVNEPMHYVIFFGDDERAKDDAALFKKEIDEPLHQYEILLKTAGWTRGGSSLGSVKYVTFQAKDVMVKNCASEDVMTMDRFFNYASRHLYTLRFKRLFYKA